MSTRTLYIPFFPFPPSHCLVFLGIQVTARHLLAYIYTPIATCTSLHCHICTVLVPFRCAAPHALQHLHHMMLTYIYACLETSPTTSYLSSCITLCSLHHHSTRMHLQSSTMLCIAHHVHHHHTHTLVSYMCHTEWGAPSCMHNA